MSTEQKRKTPTELLLELKHNLEFEILNNSEDSKYSKYTEKGYLRTVDAILAEETSDTVKKAVYDAVSAACMSMRMYQSSRDEISRMKQVLSETNPEKLVVASLADSYSRMINSMGDRFKTVYNEAKNKGYYPDKMSYFDWLWHELEVIKGAGSYLKNKALDDLEKLENPQ